MNEDVLILCLNHVVSLSAQTSHVTIDIYSLLVFQSLQHWVDYYESSGSTNTSTEKRTDFKYPLLPNVKKKKKKKLLPYVQTPNIE